MQLHASHTGHVNIRDEARGLGQALPAQEFGGGCENLAGKPQGFDEKTQCLPTRLVIIDDRDYSAHEQSGGVAINWHIE